MKFTAVFLFFLFFSFIAFAQDEHEYEFPNGFEAEINIQYNDAAFIINSFEFNITGRTRPSAMIRNAELETGAVLHGVLELQEYINEKWQRLYNERVLARVYVDHVVLEQNEDGMFPVNIIITTIDTWNIIALPRPMYSTNSGFTLTVNSRDYNFLGTMRPLRIDFGYTYDENRNHSFLLMVDTSIPFSLLGLNWNLLFQHDFEYRLDRYLPFYYTNTIGLSVDFPVSFTTLTVGLNQSMFLNEEHSIANQEFYQIGEFQEGLYMTINPFISWSIPTGLEIGNFGELVYNPSFSANFPLGVTTTLDEPNRGNSISFWHRLGFNRVDWRDNFRHGMAVSITNSFNFNFLKFDNDDNPWTSTLNITGRKHLIFTPFFGFSTRVIYRQRFMDEQGFTSAGDVLRGIRDSDLKAKSMLSFNFDFPFRVLRFTPSQWFDINSWRIFNFDLVMSPIFDMAFYRNAAVQPNSYNNPVISGGMEFIVFPHSWRALYLVVSLGWDFNNTERRLPNEIFIGTQFHY